MKEKVLVTGATGAIGQEIVKALLTHHVCMRIAVRDTQKMNELNTGRCPVVYFDYGKPQTFKEAFQGITSLFLSAPMNYPRMDELILPALIYARDNGVQHVVSLGAIGSDIESESPLMIAEKCIQGCGMDYTILRPNLLMQNFRYLAGPSIQKTGKIHLPAGDAKISFVDSRDVAQSAALAILNKEHRNRIYSLTGRESLDHYMVASILSRVTGREITYIPVSHNEAWKELKETGMDDESVELVIGLYEIARHGWCKDVHPDLREILGAEPISFDKFAEDYKETGI